MKIRSGRTRSKGAGYTIVEVMIVLAITSALFVAVAITFRGRQARAEFTQGVRNYETMIQNVINDVSSGYYRSDGVNCTPSSGAPNFTASGSAATGTKEACIFMGKMIYSNDLESRIFTLAGLAKSGTEDVSTLDQANPKVLEGVTEDITHTFRIEVLKIVEMSCSSDCEHRVFGFLNKLAGSQQGDSRLLASYLVRGSSGDAAQAAAAVNSTANIYTPANGFTVCLRGQNGQRAEIRIGTERNDTGMISVLDTENTGVCQV